MKAKVLATLVAFILFLAPALAPAFSWEGVAAKVFNSTARVSITATDELGNKMEGACTAFSINEVQRYWMTAEHCAGDDLKVDGQMATPIYHNKELDLMVLSVPGAPRPALSASKMPIRRGTPIASAGHAYGFPLAIIMAGHVAHPEIGIPDMSGTFMVLDWPIIGGMSGGPMVDMDANVMGINQMANSAISLGRSMKDIWPATSQFWEFGR